MEVYKKLIEEARKVFTNADHLAFVTYPTIKDPNMLITITKNIYLSSLLTVESVLQYERKFRRIPPVPENIDLKLQLFNTCAHRYNIPRSYLYVIQDLKELLSLHEESPMVIKKGTQLVIYGENYQNIKTISIEKVKEYIEVLKNLVYKANTIIK